MTHTTLPTQALGSTGFQITRVGLGAWAIGGSDWAIGWGPQDDRESIAAIQRAVDIGINWIDTAPIYGLGHSEDVVRRALANIPASERPYVFTKCGLEWDVVDRKAWPRFIAEPKALRAQVEGSLRRLGVDVIDLLQVHWPPRDGTEIEAYWGALAELKREGKVRAIGLSNHDVSALERAEHVGHVDTLQPPFSLIHRGFATELHEWTLAHDTGVIVYSPLQSGLLTGGFNQQRVRSLPDDDWRKNADDFKSPALERNLALVAALQPIAQARDTTVAAIAAAWVLAWPGVTGAIIGARNAQQLDGWVDAASLVLTVAELDQIAAAIASSSAGNGPAHPRQNWGQS
jgi:aryl-alcohol dehydrogenase-like predicted oxidoreductase